MSERNIKCIICNRVLPINKHGKGICTCCYSYIIMDENSVPYIEKNNTPFNRDNLLFGIITICGVIGFTIYFSVNNANLSTIGWIYFAMPFMGLLRYVVIQDASDFQNFTDLHKAVIDRRIKYYDFGSRFFVYSLFAIQISGIILILIDEIIS